MHIKQGLQKGNNQRRQWRIEEEKKQEVSSEEHIARCFQYLAVGALGVSLQDQRAFELITDVPVLKNVWAYVCFGMNVFVCGTGTILAACLDKGINKTQLVVGLF